MSESTVTFTDAFDAGVLLSFLARVKEGDFAARMPLEWTGVAGKVADGLNEVAVANQAIMPRVHDADVQAVVPGFDGFCYVDAEWRAP